MDRELRHKTVAQHHPTEQRGSRNRIRALPSGEQYQLIGQTLSQAEASTIRVGVPLLLPSARVRARAKLGVIGLSPRDFVRINLVGVPTSVIELYCEDLSSTANSLESLFITEPSVGERYGIGALLVSIFTATCSLIPVSASLLPNLVFGAFLISSCSALTVASDCYRRQTFYRLLADELKRRNGKIRPFTECVNLHIGNKLQRTG